MDVKDILKRRRIEKQLTLDDVGRLVGVSAATISRWESGDIANMKRDKIVKLAKALNISPAIIMGWDEEDPTIQKRDADLEAIEKILSADGYALCCESYDDDYFYIKDSSGKTVASLYDYELLPKYYYLKKKDTVTAEMLLSSSFSLCPEEKDHIQKYRNLDSHGKEMVDFTLLKEWERSTTEAAKADNVIPITVKESTTYAINAAHADDYMGAPDELKKQEEDMMDSF